MALPKRITTFNRDVLNPLTLRLVGRLDLAELRHVGRTSGIARTTPIMAFPDAAQGRVVIALTYGPDVQWLKNVRSAGGCSLRHGHTWYQLGRPQTIPAAEALPVIGQPQRTLLRWPIRCTAFVALPIRRTDPPSS